jgi:dihydroorotase/N-acyl-D-amino-acid deacylase
MPDILIRNARVIDGTGGPIYTADVAVKNGRITEVADSIKGEATYTIDAKGKALSPGFIDIHCHSDAAHFLAPTSEIKLRQGVTTEVCGNCGQSAAPLLPDTREAVLAGRTDGDSGLSAVVDWYDYAGYIRAFEHAGVSINAAGLVGHSTLRAGVMGERNAAPDTNQMSRMVDILDESMAAGAVGLSSGLFYAPGCFADTDELAALAAVVGRRRGFYATHLRNEAEGILGALEEALEVGRKGDAPVHISHLKQAGRSNWGKTDRIVETLQNARDTGMDVTCDVYPYHRSCTSAVALLPDWARDGGIEAVTKRIQNPENRRRIIDDIAAGIPGWENMVHNAGWEGITISATGSGRVPTGRTIADASAASGTDSASYILDLIAEERGIVSIIVESMCETDVLHLMSLSFAMIASDGAHTDGKPHPRLYGTFPRVLGRLVREKKLFSLPEAVRKMTALPSMRLGFSDTGFIREGYRADLVIFDPETIRDTADYENPRQYPVGIDTVLVGGTAVIDGGAHTGAAPGRFIRLEKPEGRFSS